MTGESMSTAPRGEVALPRPRVPRKPRGVDKMRERESVLEELGSLLRDDPLLAWAEPR